jgi:hypothetical protein
MCQLRSHIHDQVSVAAILQCPLFLPEQILDQEGMEEVQDLRKAIHRVTANNQENMLVGMRCGAK